jgi:hypothetical protein
MSNFVSLPLEGKTRPNFVAMKMDDYFGLEKHAS